MQPRFSTRPQGTAPALLGARASVVNRTHRVVRAQAQKLREERSHRRSLWAPVAICSTLMLIGCYALWGLLAGFDVNADGLVDASDQLLVFILWLVPASALLLGFIWRRGRKLHDLGEVSS